MPPQIPVGKTECFALTCKNANSEAKTKPVLKIKTKTIHSKLSIAKKYRIRLQLTATTISNPMRRAQCLI